MSIESTDEFLAELKAWQLKTFPEETIAGVYRHLTEEVEELGGALGDPLELADVLMLALCLCFHQGLDPIEAMRGKHAINLKRRWEKTEVGFRHVKESGDGVIIGTAGETIMAHRPVYRAADGTIKVAGAPEERLCRHGKRMDEYCAECLGFFHEREPQNPRRG